MRDEIVLKRLWRLLCALVLLLAVPAGAREAAPLADDPALEARVLVIASELRCLVCQNETIAASQAGLAVDLREQIRQRLKNGDSAGQIRDFMVQRYGQFVLYRPPVQPATWLLWGGPFLLLAGALAALAWRLRAQRVTPSAPALSVAAQHRADAALRAAQKGQA